MQDLIGNIIDGKYRLIRLIGEGGMGAIFEAEHTRIARKVAVKILHREYSSSEELTQRFVREAQAASAIGHPNIIEIFDVGMGEDGTVFIVMELLDGMTLKDWMDSEEAKNHGLCVAIILQVMSALVAAHGKGIIHRDLKPDNVFVARNSRGQREVKLLDFGIAKVHWELEGDQGLTKTGTVLGTPNYMSPEQARGVEVDHRIDIWGVGVILYHMLSGQPPFAGNSYNAVLSEILLEAPPPLSDLSQRVPRELAAVVEKAMAKRREDRYQQVVEMVQDLMPFADRSAEWMSDSAAVALRRSVAPPPPPGPGGKKGDSNRIGSMKLGSIRSVRPTLWFVLLCFGVMMFLLHLATDSKGTFSQRSDEFTRETIGFWSDPTVENEILNPLKDLVPVEVPADVSTDGDRDAAADPAGTASDGSSKKGAENEPLPARVRIRFGGLPKKAKLFLNGKRAKLPLRLKGSNQPVAVKATLPRHKPFQTEIVPNMDQTVIVEFQKIGRRRR